MAGNEWKGDVFSGADNGFVVGGTKSTGVNFDDDFASIRRWHRNVFESEVVKFM